MDCPKQGDHQPTENEQQPSKERSANGCSHSLVNRGGLMNFQKFSTLLHSWILAGRSGEKRSEILVNFVEDCRQMDKDLLIRWIGALERMGEYISCGPEGRCTMRKIHPFLQLRSVDILVWSFGNRTTLPNPIGIAPNNIENHQSLSMLLSHPPTAPAAESAHSFKQLDLEMHPDREKEFVEPENWGHADIGNNADCLSASHNRVDSPSQEGNGITETAKEITPYPYAFERNFTSVVRKTQTVTKDGKPFAIFLKNVIAQSTRERAAESLRAAAVPTNARVLTNGGVPPNSGIVGYYDYLNSPQEEKCRLTAFSRAHAADLEAAVPIVHILDRLYSQHARRNYSLQNQAIPDDVRLYGTVFSTVTVNSAFRTALHTDSGDFKQGLAALTVLEGNYEGVYLAIPSLNLAFDIRPGDALFFNTDLFHGNTEPHFFPWTRLSLVAYLRTNLFSPQCMRKYSENSVISERSISSNPTIGLKSINIGSNEFPLHISEACLTTCKKHQLETLRFAYRRLRQGTGALISLDMGMGKTLIILLLCHVLLANEPTQRILVLCPHALLSQWRDEFTKWHSQSLINFPIHLLSDATSHDSYLQHWIKQYGVLLCGYERFRTLKRNSETFRILIQDLAACVLDEGHRLRNMSTFTAQDLYSIGTRRRVAVTGTPLQNDLQELYVLLSWVDPEIVPSKSTFEEEIQFPVEEGLASIDNAKQKGAVEALYLLQSRLLAPVSIRRLSENLPPKSDYTVLLYPTEHQKRLLDTVSGLSFSDLHKTVCIAAHPLCFLRSCTSKFPDPVLYWHTYVENILKSTHNSDLETDFFAEHSSKLLFISVVLEHAMKLDEKTLLFSQSVRVLDLLEAFLQAKGLPTLRIDGETSHTKRETSLHIFRTATTAHAPVLLLTIRAVGVGLNLECANRVVIFEPTYNPTLEAQAVARSHRFGQTKQVFVYRLLMEGCHDSHVFGTQLRKHALNQSVLKQSYVKRTESNDIEFALGAESSLPDEVLQECKERHGIVKGVLPFTDLVEDVGSYLSETEIRAIEAKQARRCC